MGRASQHDQSGRGAMASSKNLPGYYFDAEKNRYFPAAHQNRTRASEQSAGAVSTSYQDETKNTKRSSQRRAGLACVEKSDKAPNCGVLGLIHQREVSGNHHYGYLSSCAKDFEGQYMEEQTFQPRIWNYSNTSKWSDGGLAQLRVSLQTEEGKVEEDVLTLGGTNGCLGVWQIAKPIGEDPQAYDFPADRLVPANPNLWTGEEKEAPVIWPSMKTVVFQSKITSIKRLNEWPDGGCFENGKRLQQSIILTTLGDGVNGGSLYLLHPTDGYHSNPLQQYRCALPFRLSTTNVSTSQSVWTSESNPRGRTASLGLSTGAAIVDLERGTMSWLCRSSSDVLSQQFDSSGNVVLCGFRNGAISTIDLRLPRPNSYPSHFSDPTPSRRPGIPHHRLEDTRTSSKSKKPRQAPYQSGKGKHNVSNVDGLYCSHSTVMQMKSAICSMVLLRSSEWYLLASAMNGQIQQWDRRAAGNGPLRTFEGHCNTHTTLQLGVDPSERLLVSGGEDSAVRLWSLASGRLLQVQRGLDSPVTTVSWPTSFRTTDITQWGGFREEYPFEEDNAWSLWMGSSSGLLHMHGAAK